MTGTKKLIGKTIKGFSVKSNDIYIDLEDGSRVNIETQMGSELFIFFNKSINDPIGEAERLHESSNKVNGFSPIAEPKKLNNSELVREIDWLLKNHPGFSDDSLYDHQSEYGRRIRDIYQSEDGNAALVVARCLADEMMSKDGFTKKKLEEYWTSTVNLSDDERLFNFRTFRKWNVQSE